MHACAPAFNIFFAAVINVTYTRLKAEKDITDALVHLETKTEVGGRREATASAEERALTTSLCGILFADNTDVIPQTLEHLRKMMDVNVVVCAAFGLTILETKTEIIRLRAKEMPESSAVLSVEEAGQVYNQNNGFIYLGENVNCNATLSIEVDRCLRNACYSFRKYTFELYHQPSALLELKVQMRRAEVLETMMHGCVTWSPRACRYNTPRRARHSFLT